MGVFPVFLRRERCEKLIVSIVEAWVISIMARGKKKEKEGNPLKTGVPLFGGGSILAGSGVFVK
jgi:hypothetical protein